MRRADAGRPALEPVGQRSDTAPIPATGFAEPTASTMASRRGAGHAARTACIGSAQLFGGALEVHIDHHGVVYRLKQTALGKLILTK